MVLQLSDIGPLWPLSERPQQTKKPVNMLTNCETMDGPGAESIIELTGSGYFVTKPGCTHRIGSKMIYSSNVLEKAELRGIGQHMVVLEHYKETKIKNADGSVSVRHDLQDLKNEAAKLKSLEDIPEYQEPSEMQQWLEYTPNKVGFSVGIGFSITAAICLVVYCGFRCRKRYITDEAAKRQALYKERHAGLTLHRATKAVIEEQQDST